MRGRFAGTFVAVSLASAASISFGQSPSAEFFENRIRPLLADNCFACHTKEALGGLRMSSRESLLRGGDSGPALILGNPDESLLVQAVRHARDDLQMPLGGDKLSDRQIQDLVIWIESGAPWPTESPVAPLTDGDLRTAEERGFWSFRPLARPDVPPNRDSEWAGTDIDRFIKARLEAEGLEPAKPAGRRELIRRASYDLVGLPPTPAEVEAFANDGSEHAFARVVDRLLSSPHYGERWGRLWLDVVRYGEDDTRGLAEDGSGKEVYGSAYVYRDWVIRSLNEDMPYDLFLKSQLAGDLLGEELNEKTIGGVGFLGGGPWYYDIAEPVIARADERHDRVDVTTRGFLGLTVGCARCHDHKFDPISIEDYYALAGVFYNTDYVEYPVAPEAEVTEFKKQKEYLDALEEGLQGFLKTEGEQLRRLLTREVDRYLLAAWKVTGEPEMSAEKAANEGRLDLETLERYVRFLGKEPKHYPFLKDWQAMVASGGTEEEAKRLAFDFERLLVEIVAERKKIQDKNEWIIANGTPPPDEKKSVAMPNDFKSFFDEHQLELQSLERERVNLWTDVFHRDLDGPLDYVNWEPGLLSFRGWSLERRLSRVAADHVAALRQEIEELKKTLPRQYPFVMGVKDKTDGEIRDLGLHARGSPTNLGDPVPRRFPAVLCPTGPASFTRGSGRLELAEAIASHPLAARVIVNRVWHWHFGTGIVDTPSNFGRLGERPVHAELLEYLASFFVENGMSLKRLHREILLSSVYRLSTAYSAASFAKDPANRLYWRANRKRLDAEAIRDAMLAASGNLDPELFGPSLEPSDESNVRRTLYGRVSRFRVDDYLQTFDFPNPNLTAEKRFTTNVPLQSLFFMNSDFVERQARRLVHRLTGKPPEESDGPAEDLSWLDAVSDEDKIREAYELLYSREPTAEEVSRGVGFLTGRVDEDETRLDGWIQYARVLLSANEFRFLN